MKEIKLTHDKVALVDDEDYEWLNSMHWRYYKGYAEHDLGRVNGKQKIEYMHRLIMNTPEGLVVDHIDHDGLNNQKSNLRNCTQEFNCMNRSIGRNNSSGFKGVHYDNAINYWIAKVRVNKKLKYIGRFQDPVEAAKAYDRVARELCGEFAKLNFA